ncbi:hypothetical protein [Methanobrevibacter filiformis]|uniref:Uncharacterized protein n=1 Tax=Methanobrevibacter filiformis TaxID=55758 RepID=A0A166A507_9EURY|nr:hypothetical protein [Methanobrevibacter filiformis]KZX11576.1 hypothetical protein MBFIL_13890 [Methanobrevibacter filiformis]
MESILDLYEIIYKIAGTYLERFEKENIKPLPYFSDMLIKENLLSPISVTEDGYDDEEAISEKYYENMSDELFSSFYYYSWLVLAYSMKYDFPILNEIQDDSVKNKLNRFNNDSTSLFLTNLFDND